MYTFLLLSVSLSLIFGHPIPIEKTMRMEKIVPDVVDDPPEELLEVRYNSKEVAIGSEMTPTQVKNSPEVNWSALPNSFYTLVMVDPDAPSRQNPKYKEWNHWLVVNIPGRQVDQGEFLNEYIGAGPPQGTDFHRYALMVFKQSGKLDFDEPRIDARTASKRNYFSLKNFASKYKLGVPVAGTFFKAKWDSYVPELYQQLTG